MHLLLICIIQSALSVGGSVLLRSAFQNSTLTLPSLVQSGVSLRGISGVASMMLSFGILVYGLARYKPSMIIPINTATTFLITAAFAYYFENYRYTPIALGGISLIALGILLVSKSQ